MSANSYNFSKKNCIILSDDLFTFTNSLDFDKMHHNAAFHLGLCYLHKFSFRGFQNTKG